MDARVKIGVVFWVVARRRDTREIVAAKPLATHDEAIHYEFSDLNHSGIAGASDIYIEILAPGNTPK